MTAVPVYDLLRLYRVRDWVHFLPLPLAGWFVGGSDSIRMLVGGVIGWGLALAYTSAINQAFDARVDRLNVGKNPVGHVFGRRQAILLAIPPGLAAPAVVAWLAPAGLIPALVLLFAATVYSAPPRLKRIPVVGTLWNIAVGLPGLFFADCPDTTRVRMLGGLFSLLLIVSQLIHEAEDRDDDRQGGVSTVATVTGVRGALIAATACLVCMPPLAWWLSSELSLRTPLTVATTIFAALWTGALLGRLRRGDTAALRRDRLRYRYSALALGAMVFAAVVA